MTWRVRWIVGAVVAGVVFNVLVAWAAAWFKPPVFQSGTVGLALPGEWPDELPSDWPPLKPPSVKRFSRWGTTAFIAMAYIPRSLIEELSTFPTAYMMVNQRFGWPFRAMQVTYVDPELSFLPMALARAPIWRVGFEPPSWISAPMQRPKRMPVRPVWPGFGLSTVFWSALLGGVGWSVGAIRRWRRRRIGRCPRCGYNRTGLVKGVPCPECGARCAAGCA